MKALGCNCEQSTFGLMGFGAVGDYAVIVIGGKEYSANQLLDKNVVASKDVTLYPSLFSDAGKFTVKAGQSIGRVFSWLGPEAKNNPTGKVVLQFESSYNKFYWLKDDRAVSQAALQQQGIKTLTQELKEEAEEQAKQNSPVEYYLKKYGLKALLIGGGIYLAATYGKAFIQGKLSQPKTA